MALWDGKGFQGFVRPSIEEQKHYYTGLSGSPRLIARTSTTPWQAQPDTASFAKRIWTVGDHQIVQKWCPELRSGIIKALSAKLAWDCFYPIRVGHDGSDSSPVVLLVCLPHPTLGPQGWEPAMAAALQCQALLRKYDIYNVDVEIKQSEFIPMATLESSVLEQSIDWKFSQNLPVSGSRDTNLADINARVMALLPYPGQRIEQEGCNDEAKAAVGTMGLYLHIHSTDKPGTSVPPAATYGLTSRHIVVGKRVAASQDLRLPLNPVSHDDGDEPSLEILSAGPTYTSSVANSLCSTSRVLKAFLRSSQMLFCKDPDDPHKSELYNLHKESIAYVDKLKNTLVGMEGRDRTDRTLGRVAYSPSHGIGPNKNFRDWAMIQMAGTSRAYSNKVYMAEHVTDTMFRAEAAAGVESSQPGSFSLNLDADGFLQLHGRDIPPQPPFAQDKRLSQFVAKRGQTTGLRFGITNEIEAVRRIPSSRDEPYVSYHLLVVDFVGGHFSQPGDSGSAVFDCTGRVWGIVDGGERAANVVRYTNNQGGGKDEADLLGESPSSEVTFVTPIQWILDDVRQMTGCTPEIL